MDLVKLLDRFGEAGLIFVVMAIAVYTLFKMYMGANEKIEKKQDELTTYIKDSQEKQLETMINFTNAIDSISVQMQSLIDKT